MKKQTNKQTKKSAALLTIFFLNGFEERIFKLAAFYRKCSGKQNSSILLSSRQEAAAKQQLPIHTQKHTQQPKKHNKEYQLIHSNNILIKMDYEGQKLCENLFYYIILIFGAIGWVYGYIQQDFTYVFYAWSVGMIISVIVSFV